jgi:hypothetical protein
VPAKRKVKKDAASKSSSSDDEPELEDSSSPAIEPIVQAYPDEGDQDEGDEVEDEELFEEQKVHPPFLCLI